MATSLALPHTGQTPQIGHVPLCPPPSAPVVQAHFLFAATQKTITLPSGALCPKSAIEAEENFNSPAKVPGTVCFLETPTPSVHPGNKLCPQVPKSLDCKG